MLDTAPIPAHIIAPRLLFYAIDGLGLGHVTRLLAIARAVRRRRPEAQILFLTTSEADSVIYQEGFAAIKIPSRSIVAETKIRPAAYAKLVQSVVLNTVSAFNPAILISDTFPAGATQELLPVLSWEMRRAFVFRAQRDERAWDPAFQAALAQYHLCIAPHLEGEESIPAPASVPLVWAGPVTIRDREEMLPKEEALRRLGLPHGENLTLVMFGGGGDAELSLAIETAVDACRITGWTPVVPVPPLSTKRDLVPDGALTVSYYPLAECLSAFDIAVSAAGYNSVTELIRFGVPSVLIPFERGIDDQHSRAASLAEVGAALSSPLNVASLATQLDSLKAPACREALLRAAASLTVRHGAGIAADAILGML